MKADYGKNGRAAEHMYSSRQTPNCVRQFVRLKIWKFEGIPIPFVFGLPLFKKGHLNQQLDLLIYF
jgi:hypothetical protein